MPAIDMPLEELRAYPGRNPKPDDFDAYWDEALAELDSVDPQPEVVPADFQTPFARCGHLYFTGVGGARIHALLLEPVQSDGPAPAVLQFHGYTGNAGDWQGKLPFVAMGFTAAAMDCRGQHAGASEDPGGAKGNTFRGHIVRGLDGDPRGLMFRSVFLDTVQLARVVMARPQVDPDRVGATGGSQGGALTLACGALEPRIKRLAPACPFLCDYQRVWEMDLGGDAYRELRTFFRETDPTHQRAAEFFTRLGYIDVQHLAPRIRGEVRMATGLMDDICPPSTQFAAYNKIQAPKEIRIYPDFAHEGYPGFSDETFQFLAGL